MEMFMNQPWYAMVAEIVMFANTVTMAMPTRWRDNAFMDYVCLLYTSPSPRDATLSRMPSSA